MVTKGLIVVALTVAGIVPVLGALPPQYQRQDELRSIIDSFEVVEAVGEIDKIEYVDWDLYRVTGGACHVDVKIVDVPPAPGAEMIVGPRVYTIEVGERVCE